MTKSLKTRLVVCLVFLLLGSCASQSHVKCKKQDWHQLGYITALEGKEPRLPDYLEQQCAEEDEKKEDFFRGFDKGLGVFCKVQNGFRWGSSAGNTYLNTCPANQAKGFEKAYFLAKEVIDLQQQIDDLALKLESPQAKEGISEESKIALEQEIRQLSKELQAKMKTILSW